MGNLPIVLVRSLRCIALVVPLLLASACLPPAGAAPSSTAATAVGRGELYRTGKVAYDELFSTVHDLQVEVAGVTDDRRAARSGLSQALGLLPTSPPERVVESLRQHATDLKRAGATITTTPTTAAAEGKASPEAKAIAQGLSSCLAGERQVAERLRKIPERAEAMLTLHKTLTSAVDNEFPLARQSEVKGELAAAGAAFTSMKDEAPRLVTASEKYVEDLRAAAGSTATGAATSGSMPTKAKKPSGTGSTAPPPQLPGTPATPPPPPAPKPPPKDDFNP